MRKQLPQNSKISKEARMCMKECASEFIAFVTSQAAERCNVENRKTLNGEDILIAMHALGFENYAEVLGIYLAKYRIYELDDVENRRQKYLKRKAKMIKDTNEDAAEMDVEINKFNSSLFPKSQSQNIDKENPDAAQADDDASPHEIGAEFWVDRPEDLKHLWD